MFMFKVFKSISYSYFIELWASIFGLPYFDYLDWLSLRLVSVIFHGVDTENLKLQYSLNVHIVWVPGVTSANFINDWVVYQDDQLAIYAEDTLYFKPILRKDSDDLISEIRNSNSLVNNDFRVQNQVKHILNYTSGLHFKRLVDLGSGDSNLSISLRDIFRDRYLPLDIKLGHSKSYINQVLSNCELDLILMRNSLHHFLDLSILEHINSKYVLIIDYFGHSTSFVSIYHSIYKEVFICWDINNIIYGLKQFNFYKMLDKQINQSGPTGFLFTKSITEGDINSVYQYSLIRNFYDLQMLDDDLSIKLFSINDLEVKGGMLRGLVDYFFDFRLPFTLRDFNNKSDYLNAFESFSKNNIEVKPDDIHMWIKIMNNLHSDVCDPFCGWCSRLLAFAVIHWSDVGSNFYWFDADTKKYDATLDLILYLNSSGCEVNFIYLDDLITLPDDVFIITSPFYLNFEPMYGTTSMIFSNVEDWANYIIGFINSKCKRLYPCIIQMNNYKGMLLADTLFSRIPYGSGFTSVNDLGYFRFIANFKSVLYRQFDVTNYDFGMVNKVNLNLLLKSKTDFCYKYHLLGRDMEIKNNLINNNCSLNICGHFGYQNDYISGVTIHSGQLKLLNLILDLSTLGYNYIIYAGSGNGFSVLTDAAIEYLVKVKNIRFLLLDKYVLVPKLLKHQNIIIPNMFLDDKNLDYIINLIKVSKHEKLLLLSDVRSFKDVPENEYNIRRALEFNNEIILFNKIISHFLSTGFRIDTCLKINYSPVTYLIPSEGLFMPIGITGEFRVLVNNAVIVCDLKMTPEIFNMLISSMLCLQFVNDSKKCAYCNFFDSMNI